MKNKQDLKIETILLYIRSKKITIKQAFKNEYGVFYFDQLNMFQNFYVSMKVAKSIFETDKPYVLQEFKMQDNNIKNMKYFAGKQIQMFTAKKYNGCLLVFIRIKTN